MISIKVCTNCNLDHLNPYRYSTLLNNANEFPIVHNLLDTEVMFYSSYLVVLLCFTHRRSARDVFRQSSIVFKATTSYFRKDVNILLEMTLSCSVS